MAEVAIVSKLSMASIKTVPAKSVEEGKSVPIARIFGMASGVKPVIDKSRGDVYESLTGQFGAVNLQNGQEFESGVLYLPKGIHDLVQNAVSKLQDDSASVNFALEIRVVKAANPAGYSYEAVPLIKAAVVDPLEEMRKAIATATGGKQIEAPKPTEAAPKPNRASS